MRYNKLNQGGGGGHVPTKQELENIDYAKKLVEQRENKYKPHIYTPAEKAAISISCIVIIFLLVFVPLYLVHPEYFRGGGGGNHSTVPPPTPLFSCGTVAPSIGTPVPNGLFIRKPFNQTDYVSIPNTDQFLDLTSTNGPAISFWYRMPYYNCYTPACPSGGGPFDTVPLWRRADGTGVLWEVDLLVYPVVSGPNNIKIKFSTPDQATVFYATPPGNALVNLQAWHFICYDIQLDTNRQTTAFDVWVDAVPYTVVSAQEGGGPSLYPISASTLIGLTLGALPTSSFITPVQQQDCNSMAYYAAPFSKFNSGDNTGNAAVTALYNNGQQACTVAVGSGGFGTPNLGCWLLGKGDIPFVLGYDSRTDKCIKAVFTSQISIQTTN